MHSVTQDQHLPISLDEAWEFFSTPRNLEKLTPTWMRFRIVELDDETMATGQLIIYRIRLAPLVWVPWVTEIKNVEPRRQFVDEQRVGPYAFWHHVHRFDATEKGVRVTDQVRYHVGMGPVGAVAEAVYVNRTVQKIFAYRRAALEELFGAA